MVKLMIQTINLAHKAVHFCMAVHAADAVANIGMLFYHVETVEDVNFLGNGVLPLRSSIRSLRV